MDSDSQEGGGSDSASNSSGELTIPSSAQQTSDESDSNKKTIKTDPCTSKKSPAFEWSVSNPEDDEQLSRRPSKDESSSSSESPQFGDEYTVYFYNTKEPTGSGLDNSLKECKADDSDSKVSVFANIKLTGKVIYGCP